MSLRKLLGKGKKTSSDHQEGKSKSSPEKDVGKTKLVEEKGSGKSRTPRVHNQLHGSSISFEEQPTTARVTTTTGVASDASALPAKKEKTSTKRMTLTRSRPTEIEPMTLTTNELRMNGAGSSEDGIVNPSCEFDAEFGQDDTNWVVVSRSRQSQLGDGKQTDDKGKTQPNNVQEKSPPISEQGDNVPSAVPSEEPEPLSSLEARRLRRAKRMGKDKKKQGTQTIESGVKVDKGGKSRTVMTKDQSQQITEKGLTMSRVVTTVHCEELKHKSSTLPSLIRPSPAVKRRHPREEQGDFGPDNLTAAAENVVFAPTTTVSQLNFDPDGGQGEVGVLEEMLGDREIENSALASAGWESQRPVERNDQVDTLNMSVEDRIRILVLQNEDFIACLADVCQLKMDLNNLFHELHLLRVEVEKCKEEAVNRDIEDKLNTVVKTGRSSLTLQSCDAAGVALAEQLKNVPEDGVLVPCEGAAMTAEIVETTGTKRNRAYKKYCSTQKVIIMRSRRSYSITRVVYFVISCVYNNMARLWYLYLGMCPRF